MWLPVVRNWRLNERHDGALQGKNKKETLEQYGEEQFMLWCARMTPRCAAQDPWAQTTTPGTRAAGGPTSDRVPGRRGRPLWEDVIVAEHLRGGTVLVAAHGNSLRALVKHRTGSRTRTSRP